MSDRHADLELLQHILFHPARSVAREGLRLDGRRHDRWVGRYEDGATAVEGRFLRGRRHGTWRRWSATGALELEVGFDRGRHHGPFRAWWPDGSLAVEGRFVAGELVDARAWKRDGRPWLRGLAPNPAAERVRAPRRAPARAETVGETVSIA